MPRANSAGLKVITREQGVLSRRESLPARITEAGKAAVASVSKSKKDAKRV